MAIAGVEGTEAWAALADLGEEERENKVAQRYGELASLSDVDFRNQITGMVAAECDLPNDKLWALTVSRLRVWLRLDPELVKRLWSASEAAAEMMSADQAMRRTGVMQALHKHFEREERDQLTAIVPAVFGGVRDYDWGSRSETAPKRRASQGPKKKWWWPF